MENVKEFGKDQLLIKIYQTSQEMAACAARETAQAIRAVLSGKKEVNLLISLVPSQSLFLDALSVEASLPWDRVNVIQAGEYLGLGEGAAQSFSQLIRRCLLHKIQPRRCILMDLADGADRAEERYSRDLDQFPPDISIFGIGENGHIAFNDPGSADFQDTRTVKTVRLEEGFRAGQVRDGCFTSLEQVPLLALTATIPLIMNAEYVFCMVPSQGKAKAVYDAVYQEITHRHPSTVLRMHPQATLYLDQDSAGLLE